MARRTGDVATPLWSRRVGPFPVLLIAGALVLGIVALTLISLEERLMQVADSTASTETIAGRPCPTTDAVAFAARKPAPDKTFDFNGVTFTRQFGHVNCSVVATRAGMGLGAYPVCQFSSPAVLAVSAKGRAAYFAPGLGRKATITIRQGEPACVMSAPYWD